MSETNPETKYEPIATPMKLQMRRFRYTILPIAIFLASLAGTICLWKNQVAPHGSGEVSAVSIKVYASVDGQLEASDERKFPSLLDHISVDDANQYKPVARIKSERSLVDKQEKVGDQLSAKHDELAAVQQAQQEAIKANADKAKLDALKQQEAALKRVVDELLASSKRLDKKIEEATPVRVPLVNGRITAIHRQPGEFVKQGQEIMTITLDTGGYIVSYVRPNGGIMPKKDSHVTVRTQDSSRSAVTRVEEVGTQVQQIPEHHRMNPNKPEWGILVRIAMPNIDLRPGEIVLLNYDQDSK